MFSVRSKLGGGERAGSVLSNGSFEGYSYVNLEGIGSREGDSLDVS